MLFDLIIVGGGLAGLSLACALRETRLKIALVESSPPPARAEGWDARVYAISPANADFLRGIGVWEHLDRERINPIHAMHVVGDRNGQLDFSAYESGVSELGWILEASLIGCELWENTKRQRNVQAFHGATPSALNIRPDAVELTLSDGRKLKAKLLVGADGRDSWVREAASIPSTNTPYREMGVVANFSCDRPHRNIARQWFRDDGILAWLPLPGRRISIVWSTPEEHARELLSLPETALCSRVAEAGGNALGSFGLITPPAAFALRLMRVPHPVAARVALVGDAAHGIHPLSGHGINLGFQDARELAGLLTAAPEWQDIGSERMLTRYARARKEETLVMQTATHALHRLFHETLPGVKTLRNIGLSLTDKLPIAKNLFVRYAIGSL